MAINLLPWRQDLYRQKKVIFFNTFFFFIAFAILFFLGAEWFFFQKKRKLNDYSYWLSSKIENLKEKNNIFNEKVLMDEKNEKSLRWISNKLREEKDKTLFLIKMKSINLQSIQLTELKFEKKQLDMKGKTVSISGVLDFIHSLRKFPMVSEVRLVRAVALDEKTDSSKKEKTKASFILQVKLR